MRVGDAGNGVFLALRPPDDAHEIKDDSHELKRSNFYLEINQYKSITQDVPSNGGASCYVELTLEWIT